MLESKVQDALWGTVTGTITLGTGTGAGLLAYDILTNPNLDQGYIIVEGTLAAASLGVMMAGARYTYKLFKDAMKKTPYSS